MTFKNEAVQHRPITSSCFFILVLWGFWLTIAPLQANAQQWRDNPFANPERVTILGYSDHAMEPFLSRDGNILFFNNRNEPVEQTDIHFATRVDDLTFSYGGRLNGASVPGTLDGVPTMDRQGNFYFVSLRDFGARTDTLFRARLNSDAPEQGLDDVTVLPHISLHLPLWVNFDAEITADGDTLYFVDGLFRPIIGGWREVDLSFATLEDGEFRRDPRAEEILANVNSDDWDYAAAISQDELELIFTRVHGWGPFARFSTWRSERSSPEDVFGVPERITAISGVAEAATFAPDGRALYYHKMDEGTFAIYRVTR